MTLADLMLKIRQKLLQARDEKDTRLLNELAATLAIIDDICEENFMFERASIAQDLRLAAFDTLNGTPWKSELPTIEQIEQVFGDEA
ncbi:MAG: hypothetical protein AAFU54_30915 [Chloroflexota bacterium]